MRLFLLGLIFLGFLETQAGPNIGKTKKKEESPIDVSALLKKMEECHHWGGEEPYDKARAAEIAKAYKDLKCGNINEELKKAKIQYKSDKYIQNQIEAAEKEFQ